MGVCVWLNMKNENEIPSFQGRERSKNSKRGKWEILWLWQLRWVFDFPSDPPGFMVGCPWIIEFESASQAKGRGPC